MRIEGNPILNSEFINEFQNYLSGNVGADGKNVTVRKMVKSVKKEKFESIPFEIQDALHTMFDPRCDISEKVFERQLELYFALMGEKDGAKRIPIFSDYIEWCYRQDTKKIPDRMFSIMTSKLLSAKSTELPESVTGFFNGLTEEYKRDIDKLSNERLGALINILNGVNLEYGQMPEELKQFVRQMFIRCAVKTEIEDRNKTEIRGLFRDDPRTYFNWLNKAFAGYGNYETWIDEPAKKLNLKNLVNYANMQNLVVKKGRRGLDFSKFQACARELGLRRLPEYKPGALQFGMHYIQEQRDYKDCAKKMTGLFTQMIKAEVEEYIKFKSEGMLTAGRVHRFGQTLKMWDGCDYVHKASDPVKASERYADFLISLVHLDSLTGLTRNQLFEEIDLKAIRDSVSQKRQETIIPVKNPEFDLTAEPVTSDLENSLSRELRELYSQYHENCEVGRRDYKLEGRIVEIEAALRDLKQSESQPNND